MGPPSKLTILSRTLENFKNASQSPTGSSITITSPDSSPHTLPIQAAIAKIAIQHLCPLDVFDLIMQDYIDIIYPLAPVVHLPTFKAQLLSKAHLHSPPFLRLCLSLTAMTIASLHRKIIVYGFSHYLSPKSMVTRAYELVMASRLATAPYWADEPSTDTLLCSLILGLASFYTESPSRGFVLFNESLHCCRSLDLFRREGYEKRQRVESEMLKRGFWLLYIVQIHDRLSYVTPHTPLGQDLVLTDWQFLLPMEVDDETLSDESIPATPKPDKTPVISGFSSTHPRSRQSPELVDKREYFSRRFHNSPPALRSEGFVNFTHDMFRRMIENLESVTEDIPEVLRDIRAGMKIENSSRQFDIMRVNIHITKLFLQSAILERCSTLSYESNTSSKGNWPVVNSTSDDLWAAREMICRQLLDILNFCTAEMLESHGNSMVVKIREIAATLLDRDNIPGPTSAIAQNAKQYIEAFVEILSKLDYSSQQVVAMHGSPQTS